MATRFYIANAPSSYNPAVVKGAWDANGNILFGKKLSTVKEGAQLVNGANEASATNNWDVSLGQFVSEPLVANTTLSGTLDYVLGLLGATSLNARTHVHIWVSAGNTTTVRGTLLANNVDTTNWPTSPNSFAKTALALTTVNALRGDRIIIEVGYRAVNTSAANLGPGNIYLGGTAGDLAASDNPVSTAKASWFEFSFTVPILVQPYTLQVQAAADDARNIYPGQSFTNTPVTQHLGKFNTINSYDNGWRWLALPVPQGTTVISAYMTLYSANVKAGTTAKAIFYGVAEDSATAFANNAANIPGGKTKTTASVAKDFVVANWGTVGFNDTDTIDVTSLVQEIINRAGWVSGNNIAIVARDNGSSNTNYIGHSTYNSDPTRGAKLTVTFLTGAEPTAPSSLSATQNGANIDLAWNDNSSNETEFEIQRKRGSSPNWYTITRPSPGAESYTDTDVNDGYTYYYRIRATNASGSSVWVNAASSCVMTGTKAWTAKIGAWLYPGAPATNANEEYSDGRILHYLKPEYYTVNASGVLVQLADPADGENAYNPTNAGEVKTFSEKQFFTISGSAANIAVLVNNPTNQSNAISTILAFLASTGFTGVELDWEGYSAWSSTTYGNYKTFVDALGTALHGVSKELMIDGPPITSSTEQALYQWHYEDFNALAVDYIVMLLYDYQFDVGAGASVQPTGWMRNGCAWIKGKVTDVNKIVIGMPSYGYHGTTGSFTITIDTKTQSAARTGYGTATRNADDEMTWINAGTSSVYQDTTGLNAKRERIEDEGIKNVSVWHLGGNDWFSTKQEIALPDNRIAIYSDSFNRANGAMGSTDGAGFGDPAAWEPLGGPDTNFGIVSNKAEVTGSDAFMTLHGGVNNGFIESELYPDGAAGIGMAFRFDTGVGDAYAIFAFDIGGGQMGLSLFPLLGYSPGSSIWDAAIPYDIGSKVGVKYVGSSLTVYVNDVVAFSGTDTQVGSTADPVIGVVGDPGAAAGIDNFNYWLYNNTPVANDQSVTVQENSFVDITLTAVDLDGDQLTYKIDSYPAHGDLSEPASLVLADSFDRADGSLGSSDGSGSSDPFSYTGFSPGTTYAIASNHAKCTNDGGGGGVVTLPPVQNFDISADIFLQTGGYGGFAARNTNGNSDGYVCSVLETDGKVSISKNLGMGSTLLVATAGAEFSTGDTLRFTGNGSTLKAYVNGVEVLSTTDSTYSAAGDFSALTSSTDTEYDNLSITQAARALSVNDFLGGAVVRYTPDLNSTTADSFDFTASDLISESDPATVSITVDQSSHALADTIFVNENIGHTQSFPFDFSDGTTPFDLITKTVTKVLAESVTIDEDFETTTNFQISENETITISESSYRTVTKNFTESITVAEASQKVKQSTLADSVTISEARVKTIKKYPTDSVTLTDGRTFYNEWTRTIPETITITELFNYVFMFPLNVSDNISVSENLGATVTKAITDSITMSEAHIATPTGGNADTITISEAIVKTVKPQKSDSITVSDNITPSNQGTTAFSDSFSVSDAVFTTTTKKFTESVSISEARIKTPKPVKADSVTISEAQVKTIGKKPADSVTMSESIAHVWTIYRTITDTATITESISKNTTKPITDSVTISEANIETPSKGISDSITVSESIKNTVTKVLSSSVTMSDNFNSGGTTNLSDSITVSESHSLNVTKNIANTITITEQLTPNRKFADTISVTESIKKTITKVQTETVTISENISTDHRTVQPLADSITISESNTKTFTKNNVESITITDIDSEINAKPLADSITISEASYRTVTNIQSETITVSESHNVRFTKVRTETVTIVEARQIHTTALSQDLADGITISELPTIYINGVIPDWYRPDPQSWYIPDPQSWYN